MGDSYRFNLQAFVQDLGGPTRVAARLAEIGIPIKVATVKKWLERDNLDILYVTNLFALAALEGAPLDLNRYIMPEHRRGGPRLPRQPRQPRPPHPLPAASAGSGSPAPKA